MLQDTITTDDKYNLFIQKIAESKLVWGLKSKDGWANSYSNDDEQVDVIPFWSDRGYAKICARDDWKKYLPVSIALAEFIESWCLEMAENNVLAGINWDANMFGKELPALTVALDILNRLQSINAEIKFKDYPSIADFIAAIKELEEED